MTPTTKKRSVTMQKSIKSRSASVCAMGRETPLTPTKYCCE